MTPFTTAPSFPVGNEVIANFLDDVCAESAADLYGDVRDTLIGDRDVDFELVHVPDFREVEFLTECMNRWSSSSHMSEMERANYTFQEDLEGALPRYITAVIITPGVYSTSYYTFPGW